MAAPIAPVITIPASKQTVCLLYPDGYDASITNRFGPILLFFFFSNFIFCSTILNISFLLLETLLQRKPQKHHEIPSSNLQVNLTSLSFFILYPFLTLYITSYKYICKVLDVRGTLFRPKLHRISSTFHCVLSLQFDYNYFIV